VPIVPVAIVGMRELLPMGSAELRRGKVTVRVGDPISTKGMTLHDRVELSVRLHDAVAEMMAKG
jgi:1-acyl-sn-glycerol-3-phosphate acyltransferase